MKKSKKITYSMIVLCFVFISIFTFVFMYSELNKSLNIVSENKLERSNYSIYIQETNGTYTNVGVGEKWSSYSGTHKYSKSECIDENGNPISNVVTYDQSSEVTILDIKGSTFCNVYFNRK